MPVNKRLLFFLIGSLLISFSLCAQEEADIVAEEIPGKSPFSFQIESDFYSRYVWYGMAASVGPVWQPSASVSLHGFKFTAWGNFVLDDEPNQGQFNEIDLILSYETSLRKLGLFFSLEGDLYPNGNPKSLDASSATLKTNARFTYPAGPLIIFADFAGLFVSVEGGLYGDAGVEWKKDLSEKFSVDTWLLFGTGDEKFNRTHIADVGTRPNLVDYALLFSWKPSRHWKLTPTFRVSRVLFEPARAVRSGRTQVWGGIGIIYLF
ncbi:MAG: hypothetical protein Q8P84_02820 [Deltaproteobacteria bacterium]|nr:hypothetical protein [Deltaproteobacteria bacterium]